MTTKLLPMPSDVLSKTARPRSSLVVVVALVGLVTAAHYLTSPVAAAHHELFRRLYYVPIVWGAFAFGLRGGLAVALAATLAYLPHAFWMPHHLDPAGTLDKALEIVLYFAIGALAGLLVDRERRARGRAEREALARVRAEADSARLEGLVHLTRGLAHEIRNPLGGIQGAIEILASAIDDDQPQQQMAEVGLREVGRLDRVLSDFLAFARPRPPRLVAVVLDRVLADVGAMLGPEAEARGVTLRLPDGHSAGDTHSARVVWADHDQLVQVVLNLGRNAVEATPSGGSVDIGAVDVRSVDVRSVDVRPVDNRSVDNRSVDNRSVDIRAQLAGADSVRIEVRDTGTGIPVALSASIYDPYVTTRDDGTGLGLAIAASLVRQHGAQLVDEPRDGGGTVFHFELPVVAAADVSDEAVS